jgi:hypothetical protein
MYGLPTNTDLSLLVGQEVIQMCFGSNDTQIHMSDGKVSATFSVLDTLIHAIPQENREIVWAGEPPPPTHLTRLLRTTIVGAAVVEDGTVEVCFSNGDRLRLVDDDPYHVSYEIWCGSSHIII